MYFSVYRFTFETWPFFAVVSVTAYVLIIVTFVLGFVCRLNYGKGLKHYRASISLFAENYLTPPPSLGYG